MKAIKKTYFITLIHMGDSITFGQYIDPKLRWTSLIEARLFQIYADTPVEINVLNRGVSGEITSIGIERFPTDVQNSNPDVMTLQFGMNDCNCWQTDKGLPRVSEMAFKANLIEMIVRARHFGAKHIILATNHRTLRNSLMVNGKAYEEANARYSERIREVAADTGVVLCDIRKVFEPISDEKLAQLLLPHPDQLHLSIEGNLIYADAIFPFIETAIADVHNDKSNVGGLYV